MRRVLFLFLLLGLIFFFSPLPTKAAVGELDQANEVDASDNSIAIRSHQEICQTFIPTLNRLNQVGFFVEKATLGELINVIVKDLTANETITTTTATIDTTDGWNVAPFTAKKVYPDHLYSLCLNTNSFTTEWSYKDYNSYTKGNAVIDSSADLNKDFGFLTFGFNENEENPPADENQNQNTNNTPDTSTESSEISAPSNFQAQDVPNDQGKAIKLTWQAPDGEIDGYNIYRRQSSDEEFKKIGSTKNNVLVYIDESVSPNTEYEYQITAYKGEKESSASSTAKAKAIDNLAPQKPKSLEVKVNQDGNLLELSWEANTEEDLAAYILTIENKEGKILFLEEINKDKTTYKTDKLDLSQEYVFKLQAKDSSGNVSGANKFEYQPGLKLAQIEEEKQAADNRLKTYLGIIFALLAIAGSVSIVVYNRRKKRKNKIEIKTK
ncbi:fibronectin type III domain-containing protein [bacterium]|nr:fibronectin type III domain-containing protein [bacterium]